MEDAKTEIRSAIEKLLAKAEVSIRPNASTNREFILMPDWTACSEDFVLGNDKITFGIARRGRYDDSEAFKVKAIVSGDVTIKLNKMCYMWADAEQNGVEYSNGCITDDKKHHVEKCYTHYMPCGLSLREAVLIEMKTIVNRLNIYVKGWNIGSQLISTLAEVLDGMKEAVPVTNGDKLSEGLEDKEPIGNLCKKSSEFMTDLDRDGNYGWTKTKEEIKNAVVEDTVGETFAKNIGNKTYKPEKWNEIDEALKDSEVFVIKKDSFLGNIIKSIKGMFGEGKDMKNLQEVFDESFKVKVENLGDRKED